ncbi:topoisomerase DNA-binding C4 zinc finger domain-containing protein [Cellvibrio sp. ARAG 10.3]|uniref:topoisomerase DNA-binding C4 zinc finger domain-containing protein n=1 Tax=Cellvibrio sp. ARAG 10.3 TaxID=3451358 RepID=UPI003F447C5A
MIGKNIKIFTAVVFFAVLILSKTIIGPVTCASGWQSPSIGKRGACSHHGGVSKWKAYLPFLVSGVVSFLFYINFNPSSFSRKENEETSKITQDSSLEQPTAQPGVKKTRVYKPIIKCPKCRGSMVLRTSKKGASPGRKFWGCKKYPKCRGAKSFTPEIPE